MGSMRSRMDRRVVLGLIVSIILYVSLHTYYPNEEYIMKNLGYNDFEQIKDENENYYTLGNDGYFFLIHAESHYYGKPFDSNLLSELIYLDMKFTKWLDDVLHGYSSLDIKTDKLLTPMIPEFFGLLILVLIYVLTWYYSQDMYAVWFAGIFIAVESYIFAAIILFDRTMLNIFFLVLIFFLMYKAITEKRWWLWVHYVFFSIILFAWCWSSGWFIAPLLLLLFLSLIIKRKSKKVKMVLTIVGGLFLVLSFIFGWYKLFIGKLMLYLFSTSGIGELQAFEWYFSVIVITLCGLLGLFLKVWQNKKEGKIILEDKEILLLAWIVPLLIIGSMRVRFIVFGLVFLPILFSYFIVEEKRRKFFEKPIVSICVISLVMLLFIAQRNDYSGGIHGIPLMEDSIIEMGDWINEHWGGYLVSHPDYGILYEYASNKTSRYKSGDADFDGFSSFMLFDEENAMKLYNYIPANSLIIIDEHMINQGILGVMEKKSGVKYSEKSILYKMANNQTLNNFTLVYEKQGMLRWYKIYGWSG